MHKNKTYMGKSSKINFRINPLYLQIRSLLVVLFLVAASGCKINYTMSGASISPDVKTVFIDYFRNRAKVINPTLSQTFTESMKDKFVNETGLTLNTDQGDLEFSGEITGYDIRPLAVQKTDTGMDYAAMNRLTVTVKVVFVNNKGSSRSEFVQEIKLGGIDGDLKGIIINHFNAADVVCLAC